MTQHEKTKAIDTIQKRYPGTKRQRNDHGAGHYSVEFFSKTNGQLVARYHLFPGHSLFTKEIS